MKNQAKEEKPLLQLDRDPVWLVFFSVLCLALAAYTYILFKNMSPWGFIIMIPAGALSFQALWFILNPYAIIYEDRLEIKQHLLREKVFYFIDVKKIIETKPGKHFIVYRDGEVEPLSLSGIKKSQISVLKAGACKMIS